MVKRNSDGSRDEVLHTTICVGYGQGVCSIVRRFDSPKVWSPVSVRVRTPPPVSVMVRVRVRASFSFS